MLKNDFFLRFCALVGILKRIKIMNISTRFEYKTQQR